MRASISGILNIFLILIFIVIISSFLLFNVSYSKAYRVKNKIITSYEQYEGCCLTANTACYNEIKSFEDRLGYNSPNMTPATVDKSKYKGTVTNEVCMNDLGYCVYEIKDSQEKSVTFSIRTQVSMNFPLVSQIFGIGKFGVSGTTKEIIQSSGKYSNSNCSVS